MRPLKRLWRAIDRLDRAWFLYCNCWRRRTCPDHPHLNWEYK